MKVVILAGGYGTRLSELTRDIPKPMVEIGGYPILWHIMQIYAAHGFNEFVVALGYKGNLIKKFFIDYYANNSDLVVNLKDGSIEVKSVQGLDWKITLVDTGEGTLTGGRVKRLKPYLDETFMLTYGDGLSNINIDKLVSYHNSHGKSLTLSGVKPAGRFGEIMSNSKGAITEFKEKPEATVARINGGFFVANYSLFEFIDDAREDVVFEQEPMNNLVKHQELMQFDHDGFWQPMDTMREYLMLNKMYDENKAAWKVW